MSFYTKNLKTKSFCKRVLAVSLSACLLIAPISANAESYDEKINNATNEKNELSDKVSVIEEMYSQKQNELSSVSAEIAELEAERISMMSEEEMAISELNFLKSSIEKSETVIASMEESVAELEVLFVERARIMYQHSNVDILTLFFEADDIFDFIDSVNIHKKMLEEDTALLEKLKSDKEQLELKREQQERLFKDKEILLAEIERAITDLENQVAISEGKYSNLNALLDELADEEASLNSQIDDLESDISSFEQQKKNQEEAESKKNQESLSNTSNNISRDDSGADFCWPLASYSYISSPFGYRTHPINGKWSLHTGVDIATSSGTSIFAAQSGTVLVSTTAGGSYGYYVKIQHDNGLVTLYAHCSELLVSAGDRVERGQVIAKVGSTGASTGPHLHFEVIKNGQYMQPLNYISA